jgi:hypothetical protein
MSASSPRKQLAPLRHAMPLFASLVAATLIGSALAHAISLTECIIGLIAPMGLVGMDILLRNIIVPASPQSRPKETDAAPRCANCGYELRGHDPSASCPECGKHARVLGTTATLAQHNKDWVRTIRAGMAMQAATWCAAAYMFLMFTFSPAFPGRLAGQAVGLVLAVALLAGQLLDLAPGPRGAERLRGYARGAAIPAFVAAAAALFIWSMPMFLLAANLVGLSAVLVTFHLTVLVRDRGRSPGEVVLLTSSNLLAIVGFVFFLAIPMLLFARFTDHPVTLGIGRAALKPPQILLAFATLGAALASFSSCLALRLSRPEDQRRSLADNPPTGRNGESE